MNLSPKISIITVVRNGEQHIEHTIKSIVNQSYQNIEYLIIDGNSTDRTIEIIKKYQDQISFWVSEPDSGIYDAMNKGVRASSGDWLLFIHSDDYLLSPTVIEEAVPYLRNSTHQIAYGQVGFIYPDQSEKTYGAEWGSLKKRFREVAMCIPHQATFHSRKLFVNGCFDKNFRIAGDYDFLLRHLKDHEATFFPVMIAKMRADGISFTASKIDLLRDTRKAQIKNKMYRSIPPFSWHVSAFKLLVIDLIIKAFGVEWKNRIRGILKN
ncbi:glycosyltransferase [Dyadobacter sp. CY261]|uniref:glycosyltransferase family 2 protein n=1 Tax=Dyadobacter sp. CY261 TaxID=2907203 RepID=UPI001F1B67D6|nr:glycosyltransferase family 2 protein [Dyadobacter sp. CY261]MCF0074501.1 glycosyltransferase [Dyadobacter sp. CY261]